jgi:hypothetical protein
MKESQVKKGVRKIVFGTISLVFLGAGFGVCVWKPGGFVGFPAYATAVCTVLAAVVAGNFGEHAVSQEKAP